MNTSKVRTAKDIKLHNLEIDLAVAIEQANRYNRKTDHLRVRAIREEMTEVRLGA